MECQISDPALTRGMNPSHSSRGLAGNTFRGSDHPAGEDENPKKRKRDEPAASDPKLREFLKVMKTGREGALDTADDIGDYAAVTAPIVPEEESDDEYEQIPTRREKQRRIDPPEQVQAEPSQPTQLMEIDTPSDHKEPATGAATGETADIPESKQANLEQADPAATDDDWLRSKTNRLLDLVDPDDLDRIPQQGTTHAIHQTDGENVDGSHTNPPTTKEVASKEIAVEGETAELTTNDPADAIRRTSRLFVRNLSYTTTSEDLREAFEKFGDLEEVRGSVSILFTIRNRNVMNPR